MTSKAMQPIDKDELKQKLIDYIGSDLHGVPYQLSSSDVDSLLDLFDHYANQRVKEAKKEHMIGLAEAQLLGWGHGRSGYDLESLISSMGLTAAEWKILKKDYSLFYLTDDDKNEIEATLKESKDE